MAGMHKHKWSYTVKYAPDHFGHDEMPRPNRIVTTRWLNLIDLRSIASKTDNASQLDLGSMGYQKLLGRGDVNQAYAITVPRASANAIEKIKAAGGSVKVTEAPETEKPSQKPGS
jgi:large subunit ribosomal protein L15